jgi:hypothetical protein
MKRERKRTRERKEREIKERKRACKLFYLHENKKKV